MSGYENCQNFAETCVKRDNPYRDCNLCPAHKPDPNESPSSPRMSGSPTGSRSDSPIEGTDSQLAPVLRPAVGAASEGGAIAMPFCKVCLRYHPLGTPHSYPE